jgi:hypothetical protein
VKRSPIRIPNRKQGLLLNGNPYFTCEGHYTLFYFDSNEKK